MNLLIIHTCFHNIVISDYFSLVVWRSGKIKKPNKSVKHILKIKF
jgi:hypothetical protein